MTSPQIPTVPVASEPSTGRRLVSWALLYVFGLSITTLLVGLWGSAITGDEEALSAGVRAAVETQLVADHMEVWLADVVGSGSNAATPVGKTLQRVAASPEVAVAVDVMVEAIVTGAMADPGTATTVDVAAALAPVGRVMAEELGRAEIEVSPEEVTSALSGLEPIVLAASDGVISGVATTARGVLTFAAAVAVLAGLATGALSVFLADDRIAMARTLLFRLAIGAMTFAVFTRIGAWALDPDGGRSPFAAGGSVLLRSHTGLLMAIMAAGALAGTGLGAYAVVRRRLPDEADIGMDRDEPVAEDEPTAERALVTA